MRNGKDKDEESSKPKSRTEDGINFWQNQKSSNKTYLAQYRLSNGTKKCIGCGTNQYGAAYRHAVKKRKEHEQEIAGVDGKNIITIDRLCELFLQHKEDHKCSPDTLKMFKSMTYRIRGYRLCHLKRVKIYEEKNGKPVPLLIDGKKYAHQLTQEAFDEYVKAMRGVLADGTLRTLLSRITTMIKWAGKEGYAKPKIKFRKHNKDIANSPIKSRKFKEDELSKLLDWLKNTSKRSQHNYYRLLCCSELGLRIGEVCSIRLGHIDIPEKTLQVVRLKKREKVLEELMMTDLLAEELEKYMATLPPDQKFLFQGKTGKPMTTGSEWFRRACHACDLDIEGLEPLVLHSTRSKFIMDQLDARHPLPMIMGSVGHSSITTTMRYMRISRKQSQIVAVEASNKRRNDRDVAMKKLEAQTRKLEAENAKLREQMDALTTDLKQL